MTNAELAAQLRERVASAALGGPAAVRARHTARGKLLPRDRVMRLLDPGAPFLEIAQLAAFGLYDDEAPGAGLIAGIGRVSGRLVMIVANDSTVKVARTSADSQKASARAACCARKTARLLVFIWSIRGANLPSTRPTYSPTRNISGAFSTTRPGCQPMASPRSAVSWASLHVAGGAMVSAMSDESVIVRNQGTIFLAGPPLVKAATGELTSAEELGGADTRRSGVVDHVAEDDEHALCIVREIVSRLNTVTPAATELQPAASAKV